MAKKKKKFKRGDRIVEDSRVYRIFKVRQKENQEGKEVRTIYFKPQFRKASSNGLVASIPAGNTKDARIRKPSTKKDLKEILKMLRKKKRSDGKVDTNSLKSKLNDNKLKNTAKVLKSLWHDRRNENTNFSPTKKKIYRKALRGISEEVAFVTDTSLHKARKKVKRALKKSIIEEDKEKEDK